MTPVRRPAFPPIFRLLPVAALAASGLASPIAAQETGPEVFVTGYLFASALDGRSSVTSDLPPADVSLSFSDVLKDLDFGFMTALEVRQGRWGFLGDLMYSKVSPVGTVPAAPGISAQLEQRNLTLQANLFYRVHEDAGLTFDLGAGLRYMSVDNAGTVTLPVAPSRTFADTESWVDPVVAARMTTALGSGWGLTLAGDYGGFGGASDETWQLLGTVNFQTSDRLTLRAGYRVLSVDHEDDGFVYDIRMSGPVFGATFRF